MAGFRPAAASRTPFPSPPTMKDVYTLADLRAGALPANARLGVIGNPVAHSRSPQMQQAALDAMGEDCTYVRLLCPLEEGGFTALLRELERLGFIGCNITVPFKRDAFAAATNTDALAARSGAVNTLVRTETGWNGYNTDGPGFAQAVEELCGRPLGSLSVLILGACGGAGSALATQCALSTCPLITLANRPRPELAEVARKVAALSPNQVRSCPMGDNALRDMVQAADLVVNATSLGLKEGDPMPIDPVWLRPGQAVYDIVPHDTPLRRAAAERGCKAADGMGMLLWQGAFAYRHWFEAMPPIEAMRHALP